MQEKCINVSFVLFLHKFLLKAAFGDKFSDKSIVLLSFKGLLRFLDFEKKGGNFILGKCLMAFMFSSFELNHSDGIVCNNSACDGILKIPLDLRRLRTQSVGKLSMWRADRLSAD